jgi:hypothetical protein
MEEGIMQKVLILGLFLACCSAGVVIDAREHRSFHQPGPPRGWERRPDYSWDRVEAKQVLAETADRLLQAQSAARRGRYRYGLGKAYAHQKQARNLYYDGQYKRALAHSFRAREIALEIIDANRPGPSRFLDRPPRRRHRYDDLDSQLSIKIVDDKVALRLHFNLD